MLLPPLTIFLYCHSEYSPLSPALHLPTAFFQKEGKQIANRVNDSNRPKSMAMEIIILVYADMSAQLQVAPN